MIVSPRDPALPSIRSAARELGTTIIRVRKLLITADYYSAATSREVQKRMEAGEKIEYIMREMKRSKASAYSYIPYRGFAFNLPETTVNTDRHKLFRKRKKAVGQLQQEKNILAL